MFVDDLNIIVKNSERQNIFLVMNIQIGIHIAIGSGCCVIPIFFNRMDATNVVFENLQNGVFLDN